MRRAGLPWAAAALCVASLSPALSWSQSMNWRGRQVEIGSPTVPAGVECIADVPDGPDGAQRLDVYRRVQPQAAPAPILVMVHGGGWMYGDKAMPAVIDAKLQHWVVERGFVLISVGDRLVPQVNVAQQAEDIARALAAVQRAAAR